PVDVIRLGCGGERGPGRPEALSGPRSPVARAAPRTASFSSGGPILEGDMNRDAPTLDSFPSHPLAPDAGPTTRVPVACRTAGGSTPAGFRHLRRDGGGHRPRGGFVASERPDRRGRYPVLPRPASHRRVGALEERRDGRWHGDGQGRSD